MRKRIISVLLSAVMILTGFYMAPPTTVSAAENSTGNTFADLGIDTSGNDLENHDERALNQPFGTKNYAMRPLLEQYQVNISSDSVMSRSLKDDNERGTVTSGSIETPYKFVKAVPVDIVGEGKKQTIAEMYYKEESRTDEETGGTKYDWGLYLSLVDASDELSGAGSLEGTMPIKIFEKIGADAPLITSYYNEHTYMGLTAGDYDNDGVSELVVYVPDEANPRLELYRISKDDGQIAHAPAQTFSFGAQGYSLSKQMYLTSGDITGDNVDDLAVSFTGPETEGKSRVYIFKSQNFNLASPHSFQSGTANEKNYFSFHYTNGAVAIGNVRDEGGADNHVTELVVGRNGGNTYIYAVLRYTYDHTAKKWDFKSVAEQTLGASELMPTSGNLSDLTSIACVNYGTVTQKQLDMIYLNGAVFKGPGGFDTYNSPSVPYACADYGVVSGYFGNDASGLQKLVILREKFNWDGFGYTSAGLEFAVVGGSFEGSYTPDTVITHLDPSVACAAFTAPDTDDDTMIYKYKGYELQYANPKILAVLASPPYFEDLEHLEAGDNYVKGSNTAFSSGGGSGGGSNEEHSVTAGAYVSYEMEISLFGIDFFHMEAEAELAYHYTWSQEHTMEVSTEVTYGTFGGQDSVAVYTVPYDTYLYDVWVPAQGGKPGYWQTMQSRFPYEPVYTVVPLEKYDEVASRDGLLMVGDKILKHTVGRPETYPRSSADMAGATAGSVIEKQELMGVGFGDAYTEQSIAIQTGTSTTVTHSGSVDIRAGAGAGGLVVGVVAGYEGGAGTTTSTFKNVAFTGTVVNMPAEVRDLGYGYNWKLVEYTYQSKPEDYGDDLNYAQQSFPVLQYAVQSVRRPPLLPRDFSASAVTADSVTLHWKAADANTKSYQIYRYYNFENSLAGYYPIGGVLSAGTTSYTDTGLTPYTNYRYKIVSIGSRFGGPSPTDAQSVMSGELAVQTATDGDSPRIVTQPQSTTVAAGGVANFQVIAQPAASASPNERVFYQWQKFTDGRWNPVSGGTDATLHIVNAQKGHAGLYRCAVSQQVGGRAVTVYSGAATLTVDRNTATLTLNDPGAVAAFGSGITLTASFGNTQTVKPTGNVLFYITCYPDPVPNPDYPAIDPDHEFLYGEPSQTVIAAPVSGGGTQAQITWSPKAYGSYDVTAVYEGDVQYVRCVSNLQSFACPAGGVDTALNITGIDGGTLTYGDTKLLGATVANESGVRTLAVSEVDFRVTGGSVNGLQAEKTGDAHPQWILTAKEAGVYRLTAEYGTGPNKLVVTKNITVSKAQIAVKAADQQRPVNTANEAFALELTSGTLKFSDTLAGTFAAEFGCAAVTDSPSGEYDIFIDSIKENVSAGGAENYTIVAAEKGMLKITGTKYNIKYHGVSNGKVTALIDNWDQRAQNFTTGYLLDEGTTVRFTAIPDTGYKIQKWVVNGVTMMKGSSAEYDTSPYVTVNSLNRDLTIEVYFETGMCEVSYSAAEHGTLSATAGGTALGNGASVVSGTTIVFTAHPDEGYMVSGWKVNGVTVEGQIGTAYSLTVTGDTVVEALFSQSENISVTYEAEGSGTITARTSEGGTVASGGTVTKGTTVVFTAEPTDGNSMIKEWIVNGQVVQGNRATYTASSVMMNLNVKVVFSAAILYRVNYSAIGYGATYLTASVNGVPIVSGDRVQGNSPVVFTAHPPQGFTVKQWKLGSATVQDGNGQTLKDTQYTLESLSSTVTVTVEFESSVYRVLDGIRTPDDITGVINGAEKSAAGLGLPRKAVLITDGGDMQADVDWDTENCTYDESSTSEQTFLVDGTVALPASVVNPNGVSLSVGVNVTVNGVAAGPATLLSIRTPSAVTGVINGAEKSAAGLGLPRKAVLITDGGDVQADVDWDTESCPYDESSTSEQTFSVNGTVVLPAGAVDNPDGIPLTVSIQVTVNAGKEAAPVHLIVAAAGEGGSISPSGSVSVTEGESQIFVIAADNNYSVSSVTVDGVDQGAISSYTFSNVTAGHTISAAFRYSGGSSTPDEGGSGSGGGGGGGGGSIAPPAPEYTAAVEGGGTLPVNIDAGLKRATVSASEQQGNIIAGGGTVVIDLPAIPEVSSYTLTVRADSLSARADSLSDRTEKGTLTLNTDAGRLTLPANMLTGISAASGKQAEITIGQADASALPDNIKTAVGDRPLIQLTLSLDGEQTGWSNPDAPVTVSIPYVPTAEELANPESIVIWYIDGSGKAVSVPNGHYDPVTGSVTFSTTHFSLYSVAHREMSFRDVAANAWYRKAVRFIAARDVTDGTGGGNFSPNAKLTRGQFIVMLMKAYQIGPDTAGAGSSMAEAADNFADAGNTWYTGYLAAAKRLGISTGAGNNLFAPDREITRQEMFTLLYNGLKAVGELPHGSGGKKLSGFSDAEQVAHWAAEAMSLMAETGTIAGSGGKLSPAGTATRAEMAQVLYHLLSQ